MKQFQRMKIVFGLVPVPDGKTFYPTKAEYVMMIRDPMKLVQKLLHLSILRDGHPFIAEKYGFSTTYYPNDPGKALSEQFVRFKTLFAKQQWHDPVQLSFQKETFKDLTYTENAVLKRDPTEKNVPERLWKRRSNIHCNIDYIPLPRKYFFRPYKRKDYDKHCYKTDDIEDSHIHKEHETILQGVCKICEHMECPLSELRMVQKEAYLQNQYRRMKIIMGIIPVPTDEIFFPTKKEYVIMIKDASKNVQDLLKICIKRDGHPFEKEKFGITRTHWPDHKMLDLSDQFHRLMLLFDENIKCRIRFEQKMETMTDLTVPEHGLLKSDRYKQNFFEKDGIKRSEAEYIRRSRPNPFFINYGDVMDVFQQM
jgi:hypothetical protein